MSSSTNTTSTTGAAGLFPGYKYVEEFGPDEDYEDAVGECYITLDLGSVDQTLISSSSSYRLVGLDSATPFLQLSGTIMKGHYQTLVGTELIFKDVSEESDSQSNSNIQYFTKTDRRIVFREVTLKPKSDELTSISGSGPSARSGKKKYTFIAPFTVPEEPGATTSNVSEQSARSTMQVDTDVPEKSTESRGEPEQTDEVLQASGMEVDS